MVDRLERDPPHRGDRLLGAVGYWIFDFAVLWLAFRALGSAPPFGAVVMGYLIGMLAGMLPIPGGIGAVDLGLVGMLAVYGAPLSAAAAAVLIYRPSGCRRSRARSRTFCSAATWAERSPLVAVPGPPEAHSSGP